MKENKPSKKEDKKLFFFFNLLKKKGQLVLHFIISCICMQIIYVYHKKGLT